MSIPKAKASSIPVPVRLYPSEEECLTELSERTGIPKAEIIRRCLRFALPAFLDDEASLLNYGRQAFDGNGKSRKGDLA